MAPGLTPGHPLAGLDWQAPWLAPWRSLGMAVAQQAQAGLANHQALNAVRERLAAAERPAVGFVEARAMAPGATYESYIFDSKQCPTREGLHDFFNGLCWLHFPQAKARINALQAAEIAAHGVQGARGPVRDALTVLDENGALLQAPPALWQALRARDWLALFVTLRPLWAQARLLLFGHALLEQLVRPRKGLTAHVWADTGAQPGDPACAPAELDAWLATRLSAERLAAKPFTPLPVLGVPGWWPANENFCFYDDSSVFRPRRPP